MPSTQSFCALPDTITQFMTDNDRREFLQATGTLGAAGLIGLAGCSGGPSDGESTPTESGDAQTDAGGTGTETTEGVQGTETATGDGTTHVGMVYAAGGLGDGSFNDQAQQGIKQAESELNVQYNEAQPDEASQFGNFQQQFASSTDPNYDLVSCIGFLQADALTSTASEYPDQNFQIVDSTVEADNVASYMFREHEGSYLVGVLAALLTTQDFEAGAGSTDGDTTNVGFVGGVEGDVIARFEAGYEAGVNATNGDVNVQTSYVGSFSDPQGGQEAALAMYNSGADIVYHAAGNTGTGVFRAAQEQGRFAIGVDRDQSITKPGFSDVILASMTKRVDTAVYDCVEAVANGEFPGGQATTLGLAEEGVACVYGDQLGSEVPEDVKSAVSDAREGIVNGDISVPQDPSNV